MRRHQIQHNYLHSSVKVCQCHWINQFAENFILPPRPIRPIGPLILGNARLVHLNTADASSVIRYFSQQKPTYTPYQVRWHVVLSPCVDRERRHKVLVDVVHVLEHIALHSTRDGDMVDQATAFMLSTTVSLYQMKIFTSDV